MTRKGKRMEERKGKENRTKDGKREWKQQRVRTIEDTGIHDGLQRNNVDFSQYCFKKVALLSHKHITIERRSG